MDTLATITSKPRNEIEKREFWKWKELYPKKIEELRREYFDFLESLEGIKYTMDDFSGNEADMISEDISLYQWHYFQIMVKWYDLCDKPFNPNDLSQEDLDEEVKSTEEWECYKRNLGYEINCC